ncbi:uncharacterized protein LOC127112651 [Lathyrus oleraceus]|uniref:uncharacterized protein LOC127112651 n=1 Tax=Pisum sativum TaxID=3888 RepID=UPI0021D2896A|nr:uncharacterized protein LOC127112651 [Pisum sativum]
MVSEQLNTVDVVYLTIVVGGGVKQKMDGRNDVAIVAALQAVAQGRYDPDGAQTWLREIERIFKVMDCSESQKVREFLRKYFPEDVCGKKEIEFLELKQGNLSVIEYVSRFVELAKFDRHYSEATTEFSRCIQFENGLRPKIKQRVVDGKRLNGGGGHTPFKCYRFGELGHRVNECKSDMKKCYKCGKSGHLVADCKENMVTCYNCGEPGHISTHFPKLEKASTRGKVFALTGTQTSSEDKLI